VPKRIAAIGDVHGMTRELRLLLGALEWMGLDEIWGLGDLVDRGPDSIGSLRLMRERGIPTILGNHDASYLNLRKKGYSGSVAKQGIMAQLLPEDWEYLEKCPLFRVDDSLNTVLVHGGLWPGIPLHKQPFGVVFAQMVHPGRIGEVRWWGEDEHTQRSRCGYTEAESRKHGFERWYRVWDGPQDVYYGHSVFAQPNVWRNGKHGLTVGIDTGACFGGALTAAIIDGSGEPRFVSVKADKVYAELTNRTLWEN
jgi:hypothetical protein